MEIYLDSSKIEEYKKWRSVISGVTTNPSILLKDGSDIFTFCAQLDPETEVSIEASGDFITEARKFAKLPNIKPVIKIPLLKPGKGDNLDLIDKLTGEGITVNCTVLFSLSQVILATKAGAAYVSLFAGRIDDEGGDSFSIIKQCVDFLGYEDCTQLIIGSIRGIADVQRACTAGAHIVTIPPAILEKMLEHKYSRITTEQFEKDAECLRLKK